MKTLIIDDERRNIVYLRELLEQHFKRVQIVGEAQNGPEGIELIQRTRPDLVLLDIQMPGMTGFEMLEKLDSCPFAIVFVTGYQQYAIQAVKMSALDYILKPVQLPELRQAIEKAEQKMQQHQWTEQIRQLLENYRNPQAVTRIALPSTHEIEIVKLADVIRCESVNSYTDFFLLGGQRLRISKPILEYEEQLKLYGFLRSHQSHLVNSVFVKKLVKSDGMLSLLLADGTLVPVARNRREAIRLHLLKGGPGILG